MQPAWARSSGTRWKVRTTAVRCIRIQDWFIKYQLNSVPGVAEVASVGGFVKQYQIDLDPMKLRAYNIPLKDVIRRGGAQQQ
jgi:Cu/Ag efflux pump CusA